MHNVVMLSVMFYFCNAECHYVECRDYECHNADVIMLSGVAPLNGKLSQPYPN